MNNWPTISGIDIARVKEVLGGDVDFFKLLLTGFVDSASPALTAIHENIEQGKREAAAAVVHRLRGEAANLGAMQVFEAATVLETTLRHSNDDLHLSLVGFEAVLSEMLASSQYWLAQKAAISVESSALKSLSNVELAEWQAQLQELATLLAAGSARARRQSQAIAEYIEGSVSATAYAPIKQAVDEFDFPGALAALNQLRA